MKLPLSLAALLAALLASTPALRAQLKPVPHTSETIYLSFAVLSDVDNVFGYSVVGAAETTYTLPHTNASTWRNTGPMAFNVTVGQAYQIHLAAGASSWSQTDVRITAPPGYRVFIAAPSADPYREMTSYVAAPVVGSTDHHYAIFTIMPADGRQAVGLGLVTPPQTNGNLFWNVGLGVNAQGRSVGSLGMSIAAITSGIFNQSSLSYTADTNDLAVIAINGTVHQVFTPQAFVDVHPITQLGSLPGYALDFYGPGAAIGPPDQDGLYGAPGSPGLRLLVQNYHDNAANRDRLLLTREEGSRSQAWLVTQTGSTEKTWTVEEVDLNRSQVYTSTILGNGDRQEDVEIRGASNAVAQKTRRIYRVFNSTVEELIQEIADPASAALTTTYDYYHDSGSAGTGNAGRLKAVTRPDGSWIKYEYFGTASTEFSTWGQLKAVYTPWQDSSGVTAANASASNSKVTLFNYTAERSPYQEDAYRAETKILGTTVSLTESSFSWGSSANSQPLRSETINTYTASGTYLTSSRKVYNETAAITHAGRVYSATGADGTMTSSYVAPAWYNSGNNTTVSSYVTITGWSTAVSGSTQLTTMNGYTIDPIYVVPNRSTRITEGRLLGNGSTDYTGTKVEIYTSGGGWETISEKSASGFGPYQTGSGDVLRNSGTSREWTDGVPSVDHGVDGTTIGYAADAAGRITVQRKYDIGSSGSYPAQNWLYTHYQYDGAGHVVWQRTNNSSDPNDTGPTIVRAYDLAGRLTAETGVNGLNTYYSYNASTRTTTVTYPGGATRTTSTWVDGSPKSVTGTAVVPAHQQVEVTSGGTLTTTAYVLRSSDLSSPTSAPRWTSVKTDWAGRKVTEEKPKYSSGTFAKTYYYNSTTGQLTKTTEPGLADTLVAYNEYGEAYRTGLDLNANGTLDLASNDRLTETTSTYLYENSAWWAVATTLGYNQASSSTPYTAGVVKKRLTGFSGTLKDETRSTDLFNNLTVQTVDIDPTNGLVTTTADVPDSSTNVVTVARHGLAQYVTSAQGLTSWTYYDSLGRVVKQTDPRTDTSTTARLGYYTSGTGSIGQVAWQDDSAGNRTSFTYSSSTGRLASTTNPLSKTSYQSYNDRGQVTRSWGQTTYPVEYGFDDYGQQTTMSTYRGGSGWDAGTWPSSPGTADPTTWAYENATGLLLSKTDAQSHAVTYSHNTRGQLYVRTWSRTVGGSPLTTTYAYDSGTAEQTGIDYSDSTPDLTYTYDRMGQTATVADATGTRSFAYSSTDTTLTSETLPSYLGSRVLTRKYATSGVVGRNTGYTLSGASGSGTDQDIGYGYDGSARFNSIAVASGPSFTYAFASNSNLIGSITEATSSGWTETMAYESNRNLLASITGQYGTASKATFAYAHDDLGRRTSVIETGEVFSRYSGGGLFNLYGYNDRSELTSAQAYLGTSLANTSNPVAGRGFGYAFDNIGNRTSFTSVGNGSGDVRSTTYTSNSLNQVTARASPGSTDVTGFAPTNASVSVNSTATVRQGEFYFLNVAAGSRPLWQALTSTSSLGGSTPRYSFIPAANETISYDADGNITSDGRWTYTWDAENRLKSMETTSPSVFTHSSVYDARRIDFAYDYLGRRVEKYVRGYNGSAFTTDVAKTRFVYNGWNVVAELNGLSSNALLRSNAWGLDLSGTLSDGGGVGGLLSIKDGSTFHLPVYDANGNVAGLVDKAAGTLTAAYEYSPFGEGLRATGTYAATNNFRFSTKYTDAETGLLYYGYRYYDPHMGRFLGRDPSGEKGGIHLYAFCGNNPVNRWDILGLTWGDDPVQDFIDFFNSQVTAGATASLQDLIDSSATGISIEAARQAGGRELTRGGYYDDATDSWIDREGSHSFAVDAGPLQAISYQDPSTNNWRSWDTGNVVAPPAWDEDPTVAPNRGPGPSPGPGYFWNGESWFYDAPIRDATLDVAGLIVVPPAVGRVFGAIGGWVGERLGGLLGRAATRGGSFTTQELGIINEARGIMGSTELASLRAAHNAGQPLAVSIGGRVVQYEPGLSASGMTMFGENGFVLGNQAFRSAAEIQQTVLQELYRLSTSQSAAGVTQALATAETNAAAGFAARAVGALAK